MDKFKEKEYLTKFDNDETDFSDIKIYKFPENEPKKYIEREKRRKILNYRIKIESMSYTRNLNYNFYLSEEI